MGLRTVMKVCFVSLGCDKNLVDTEKMLALLAEAGYELTDDDRSADVCVINTCCFIHDAMQESINTILEYGRMKKSGSLKGLIVTGCLAQRYKEDIIRQIPEVDAVVGTFACGEIVHVIDSLGLTGQVLADTDGYSSPGSHRIRSSFNHYSFLKIAEGCDKYCTYCIIPYIRGHYRSYPMEDLVEEAASLAASGVNELILVAQETTLYGTDLYGRRCLPELVHRICSVDGIDMVRLMYCYPEEIDDEFISMYINEPKLCNYIDMPIQHISDRILRLMGRRTDGKQIRSIIDRLRSSVPDIAIRTSLITGFPGETEEDQKELLSFIDEYRLDRVGVFTYSREEGTPASKMNGQVHHSTRKRRQREVMERQQKVVFEKNASFVGKEFRCIVDGRLEDDDVYVGRTYMDAPDIDGCVFFESNRELMSGSLADVRISGYQGYDLSGIMIN